ncbi:AurF N-oxygenase family protein [Barrientosiimonas endolithica]|uniref:Membrane protein n=1 Tax=Barrientosiimonas endolithica TaxID=1535208 RepID=A0ABN6YR32_9MICO|nr:diiron oxygenase [Barrientosiimonas endolithica]BDZ59728.1 membrane protein [Barrientosiimonas endolithica]
MTLAHEFRAQVDADDTFRRLLSSSEQLSYDPNSEIDWETPLDPTHYGLNPEWSTLYGTPLWSEMSEEQRITLTRHEVGSIMMTGIWFEMILQQMILRDQYVKDPAQAEFRFALTEIADECRHSLMFARACSAMGVPQYKPHRINIELARFLKTTAFGETSYGAILVAEEMLDVMQRDWMRGDNVLEIVRGTSRIHVVEEARHMAFARAEMRDRLADLWAPRRQLAAKVISIAAYVIATSMVRGDVYANAGLDKDRAMREAKENQHHHNLMRLSSIHLMDFLSECRLLTKASVPWYRAAHML